MWGAGPAGRAPRSRRSRAPGPSYGFDFAHSSFPPNFFKPVQDRHLFVRDCKTSPCGSAADEGGVDEGRGAAVGPLRSRVLADPGADWGAGGGVTLHCKSRSRAGAAEMSRRARSPDSPRFRAPAPPPPCLRPSRGTHGLKTPKPTEQTKLPTSLGGGGGRAGPGGVCPGPAPALTRVRSPPSPCSLSPGSRASGRRAHRWGARQVDRSALRPQRAGDPAPAPPPSTPPRPSGPA